MNSSRVLHLLILCNRDSRLYSNNSSSRGDSNITILLKIKVDSMEDRIFRGILLNFNKTLSTHSSSRLYILNSRNSIRCNRKSCILIIILKCNHNSFLRNLKLLSLNSNIPIQFLQPSEINSQNKTLTIYTINKGYILKKILQSNSGLQISIHIIELQEENIKDLFNSLLLYYQYQDNLIHQ